MARVNRRVPWQARLGAKVLLPTPRAAMRAQFRDLSDEDLRTYHVNIVLRPSADTRPGGEAR